jgi:hypothetical protein
MTRFALLFSLLLPLPALAQLQIFEFDGTTDTPITDGALVNVGTAAPGDTVKARFHVRNTGQGPATFETLALAGQGFTILSAPSLPYILAPYIGLASEAEFDVAFSPTIIGSFSAFLDVNNLNFLLQGTSAASAVITLLGSQTPLTAGQPVDFSVAINTALVKTFVLFNSSGATLTVNAVTVSGAGFSGPIGLSFPLQIGPGQSSLFQVSFTPRLPASYSGTLAVDNRSFVLAGLGLDPPLPSASMVFSSSIGASAQQNSLTIPLASAAQRSGTGTLTMAFQSNITGVSADPAIEFLSGPLHIATVTIAQGATSALIGGQPSMAFQTGTTAGTITFSLTLENNTPQQTTLIVPPSPIILSVENAVRLLGSVNVSFSGFDNTYSASQMAFTFYDLKGNIVPQGVINVDAGSMFQQYFSTTQAGGAFALLATFPVTGETTQIGSVTAQLTNSVGATTALQIPIGN